MATHRTPPACGSRAQQESTALMIADTTRSPQFLIDRPWRPDASGPGFPYRRARRGDRSARPPDRSTTARRWPSHLSVALPLPGRHRADYQRGRPSQHTSCSPCTQAATAHANRLLPVRVGDGVRTGAARCQCRNQHCSARPRYGYRWANDESASVAERLQFTTGKVHAWSPMNCPIGAGQRIPD
jgi:hypothetical protein